MVFEPDRPDLVVGVVGAGTMGRGIAQLAAMHGIRVLLGDSRPGADEEAESFIVGMLERAVAKGRMEEDAARGAVERIELVGDRLAAMGRAHLVIEAIVEDLTAKRALFRDLEQVVGADVVLATNTSSLSVTAIASGCRHPERVAGLHFFNPVPLMRVVEIAVGELTAPSVRRGLVGFVKRLGHQPAITADTPGFLVNHAGRGLSTEAVRIVDEGIADFAGVDRIVRDVLGLRMGPFELMDLVGLDVSHAVMESIYAQFHHEPRFRPSVLTGRRMAAGLLGRKTGRGFYEYVDNVRVEPPEQEPHAPADVSFWIEPGPDAAALSGLLEGTGRELDRGEGPEPGSAIVLMPFGRDATSVAVDGGHDPVRTIAVDTFNGLEGRVTLMATPLSDPGILGAVHRALLDAGRLVTVIRDSPGFVAPRIAASIVNVACEMAQRRIATPIDIDRAVRLGLGYPEGPLEMGDRIGPKAIVELLEALHGTYLDPRYRPSAWLTRRARLGVSLSTTEPDIG